MFRLVVLFATLVAVTSSASIPNQDFEDILPLDGRIVGGSVTDISKHPHIISLRYKSCDTCSFNHRCGGSILSSRIVLTAAHCVLNIQANRLHVIAGSNVRNGAGTMVPVEKHVTHEDYNKKVAYDNDVAVLILKTDLPLNGYDMKPIELAESTPRNGQISTVTGWGTTTEGGSPSDVLLEVDVPIVSNDICDDNYGGSGRITDSMVCAGIVRGGKDACQGDSGGPLLVNGALVGIVSWGSGCARPNLPGVYGSVPNLKPWIESVIAANS